MKVVKELAYSTLEKEIPNYLKRYPTNIEGINYILVNTWFQDKFDIKTLKRFFIEYKGDRRYESIPNGYFPPQLGVYGKLKSLGYSFLPTTEEFINRLMENALAKVSEKAPIKPVAYKQPVEYKEKEEFEGYLDDVSNGYFPFTNVVSNPSKETIEYCKTKLNRLINELKEYPEDYSYNHVRKYSSLYNKILNDINAIATNIKKTSSINRKHKRRKKNFNYQNKLKDFRYKPEYEGFSSFEPSRIFFCETICILDVSRNILTILHKDKNELSFSVCGTTINCVDKEKSKSYKISSKTIKDVVTKVSSMGIREFNRHINGLELKEVSLTRRSNENTLLVKNW